MRWEEHDFETSIDQNVKEGQSLPNSNMNRGFQAICLFFTAKICSKNGFAQNKTIVILVAY